MTSVHDFRNNNIFQNDGKENQIHLSPPSYLKKKKKNINHSHTLHISLILLAVAVYLNVYPELYM